MTRTASPLSILHVDDDAALGDLVKTYLERDDSVDCTVTTTTSTDDALARLRADETDFDCVVSDYRMPGTDGIAFLHAVRETHPSLPFLLFSGEETGDVAAEIVHAGVTDYLRKGYGTDQYTMLVRRIEHAVDADGQFDPHAETAVDAIGIVGSDERFDRVDTGYAALYDYDPDEVEGKHWTDLHPEDEVEHIRTHVLPVVQQGGKWTGQSTGLRADGSTFTESKMVTALDDDRLLISVSEVSTADPDE
ncbi:response regulator [Haloplanus aerogenes]|uniref:PAS domain S-box-containing protein n=1 Tax=Haloplanus aerogenes TaxID=660522 RepID=A0A3M0CTL7_9EURY|nr:response regulator [Haloplanus aerogenes]AZH26572.1 response regulator [Haloplanus aerogenes]RMB12802.1 PAS domain S-box-containing protein [Haloplanus aerogenes]